MQITVTIPDELAAAVRARGLTPEGYVEGLIAEKVEPISSVTADTAARLADLEVFFKEMASHPVPRLPEEAFTRESFYQDHD